MCGIIGYCGAEAALPIVLQGLRKLEYRGYDSSGVAIIELNGSLTLHKTPGRISDLIASAPTNSTGTTGIGHTRWATHGKPVRENAHPHTDCQHELAVVHNGIVENYRELKARLERSGHKFQSQTDTEVIPHLIEEFLAQGESLTAAVRSAGKLLTGAQAIVVTSIKDPGTLVGLRLGNAGGIVVGYGTDGMYLASDLPAILGLTNRVAYLESGQLVTIRPGAAEYVRLDGGALSKRPEVIQQDPVSAAKGPYKHFMLKEIMEQPETLVSALHDRIDFQNSRINLDAFPFTRKQMSGIERVVMIGMGTSYHTAMIGRLLIENFAGLPADAENASEYRYRHTQIAPSTLVVSVTQSGETVDTLVAMAEAKARGARQIAVTNVAGSEATRVADYTMLIHATPEVAVASTKTYVGAIVCLYLLALHLGEARGVLNADEVRRRVDEVAQLPNALGEALRGADYEGLARHYANSQHVLVLGRGFNYPTAMEGALKLKEVSYIHAEGYPAGEMKHGPIALIDEHMPVIAIAPRDRMYEKMMSNIDQVKARDGQLIAIATVGDEEIAGKADHVLFVPRVSEELSPIITVAPLQLLAYHIAVRRGCDVDQPRNLAKTVTVE